MCVFLGQSTRLPFWAQEILEPLYITLEITITDPERCRIFAKGNVEKISYVKAAKELPLLTDEEVEQEALRYGLIDTAARGAVNAAIHKNETVQEEDVSKNSGEDSGIQETKEEV